MRQPRRTDRWRPAGTRQWPWPWLICIAALPTWASWSGCSPRSEPAATTQAAADGNQQAIAPETVTPAEQPGLDSQRDVEGRSKAGRPSARGPGKKVARPRGDDLSVPNGEEAAVGNKQAEATGKSKPRTVAPPDKGPSLDLLSPEDQEMVRKIARRIEAEGLAALSYPELEFASQGPGRPYLFDRLREAAAQSTGGLEDDAARLLDLDVDAKLAFKLIESPLERSRIMRIGEVLVERDRALDEEELRYARESPFLRVKLEEYLRLGIDPERAAARLRGERNRLEQEIEARQQEIVRINRTLKADVRSLEKLEARLNRQRRASSQSVKALMRTMELEQELIDLAERVEARKGELKYVEDRLSEARHELERLGKAVP